MDYSEYIATAKGGKTSVYKNHIIKNIEIIGQRKLVIISESDGEYELLLSTIDQLRKKNVRVPEIAFRARIAANAEGVSAEGDLRFIDEVKGKASSFYALILAPYTQLEMQLAAMSGIMGSSAAIAEALRKLYGYTERDYCEINEPSGIGMSMANMKSGGALNGEIKRSAAMENQTAGQLASYKDKMKGQRCFILGHYGAKLDELNALLNERTFACNAFCDFFSRTPQRPAYFLLSDPAAYLGNGKYIEGMECFINGDVKVFEDKFKKKPTYINDLGNGIVSGLSAFASFQTMQQAYETAHMMPLYEMLQLALYMGFSEIYLYGFSELYTLSIDEYGIGRLAEGTAEFPEKAKQLFSRIKDYADSVNTRIFNMCEGTGLSMFDTVKFEDIDFTASSIFSKI